MTWRLPVRKTVRRCAAVAAVAMIVLKLAPHASLDSRVPLSTAVWSADEERATRVAEQLEVGMTNVNTPAGEGADLPFGGTKRSGFGRELGPLGIDEFVNKRLFYIEK